MSFENEAKSFLRALSFVLKRYLREVISKSKLSGLKKNSRGGDAKRGTQMDSLLSR